jgi:hypothetical protein
MGLDMSIYKRAREGTTQAMLDKLEDEVNKLNEQTKEELKKLHASYNMYVEDYDTNGEEDFNCWLNLFREKENA